MDMFLVNFKATLIFQIFAIKFSKFWRVLSYYNVLPGANIAYNFWAENNTNTKFSMKKQSQVIPDMTTLCIKPCRMLCLGGAKIATTWEE